MSGEAVLSFGDELKTLSCSDSEFRPFRFERLTFVTPEDLTGEVVPDGEPLEAIRKQICSERNRSDLIFFLLASFDRSLGHELQRETADYVEGLLENPEIEKFAYEVVLSESFRQTSDASLELKFRDLARYSRVVNEAIECQSSIEAFWRSWQVMSDETDPLSLTFTLDSFRDLLLRTGFVSKFVKAIHNADSKEFNSLIIGFTLLPEVKSGFGQASHLLNTLKNALHRRQVFTNPQLDFSTLEVWQGSARGLRPERQLGGYEVFSQVTKQIESIKALLFTGSQSLVDKALRDLLNFQKKQGGDDYIAKTLCNLAAAAIDANEIYIAKELADRAVSLGVKDVVVDSTAAEVLKNLGRFDEAREQYEAALLKFGEERYLLNGLADVLKDCGNFDRSLSIYVKAEKEFPDDPVAPNGITTVYFDSGQYDLALIKAKKNLEVYGDPVSRVICGNILRHLGRYHESLAIMRSAVNHFPNELRIWSGFIRSLGLAGRNEEALERCNAFIQQFPNRPSPYSAKGELLRKMGRLAESLDSYNKGLSVFPYHRGLQMGKATVLLLLGSSNEASVMIDANEPQTELDWRAYHVWAAAPARIGDYATALENLESGLKSIPWIHLRSLFTDTIGYIKLRMGDPYSAIKLFEHGLKSADSVRRNGLFLLLSRAYSETGHAAKSERYFQFVSAIEKPIFELRKRTKPGIALVKAAQPYPADIAANEWQLLFEAA
jgi:tetratricopeptide (TPR) repeat protein